MIEGGKIFYPCYHSFAIPAFGYVLGNKLVKLCGARVIKHAYTSDAAITGVLFSVFIHYNVSLQCAKCHVPLWCSYLDTVNFLGLLSPTAQHHKTTHHSECSV